MGQPRPTRRAALTIIAYFTTSAAVTATTTVVAVSKEVRFAPIRPVITRFIAVSPFAVGRVHTGRTFRPVCTRQIYTRTVFIAESFAIQRTSARSFRTNFTCPAILRTFTAV